MAGDVKKLIYLCNEIDAKYHEVSKKIGLPDCASRILYNMRDQDECPLSEITRLSGDSKQTINSALRKMEADGIIFLTADGGKKKNVCLTEKGKTTVANTVSKFFEIENAVLNSWSGDDIENYVRLTQKYLSDFTLQLEKL